MDAEHKNSYISFTNFYITATLPAISLFTIRIYSSKIIKILITISESTLLFKSHCFNLKSERKIHFPDWHTCNTNETSRYLVWRPWRELPDKGTLRALHIKSGWLSSPVWQTFGVERQTKETVPPIHYFSTYLFGLWCTVIPAGPKQFF